MKTKKWIAVFCIVSVILFGCGSSVSIPFVATGTPTGTPTSTATRTKTPTPRPTATSTPDARATVISNTANIRGGPSTDYGVVASVAKNTELIIVGRNSDCTWLAVTLSTGLEGWVRADLITFVISCQQVSMVPSPPTPTPKPYVAPPSTPCSGETVQIHIINGTGGALTLILRGPCSYTFALGAGDTYIGILPGNYSYTAYACGGASVSGSKDLSGGDEWNWWCQ